MNTVIFAITLVIAGLYIYDYFEDVKYSVYFIVLYSFGIYSIYFSALYSEALFMAEIVSFFYFMRKHKYILMGIAGAMCSATRNIGVFLVFVIAVFYTEEHIKKYHMFSIKCWLKDAFSDCRLVFGTVLIPLGLFSYMAYLYFLMGDPLAFMHVERAWGRSVGNPVTVLLNSVTKIGSNSFYWSLFALIWIFACYKLLKNKQFPEAICSIIFLLIPLSTLVDSMPRYMIGCFVPMLGLTNDFKQWTGKKRGFVMIASFCWEIFLIKSWFDGAVFMI